MSSSPSTYAERIAQLRTQLSPNGLTAWVVPTADPHLSEYLPEHWQTRQWLSGFDGSAGALVVTHSEAGLFTDSRYWEQAQSQLQGTGIALHKVRNAKQDGVAAWLASTLPAQAVVGVAAQVVSLQERNAWQEVFKPKQIVLQPMADIAAPLWHDRPSLPANPIYPRLAEFVDQSAASKLQTVREQLQQKGASALLLSDLADIAWLTNLRGSDVDYNPVFLAHMLVTPTQATLWVQAAAVADAAVQQAFQQAGIAVKPYAQVVADLAQLPSNTKLWLDPAKVAVGTLAQLPSCTELLQETSPVTMLKACKSTAELAHIRQAMLYDGIALCQFFADFEQRLAQGELLTELDVDTLITAARAKQPYFVSCSFSTIAGFNANGALPHYRATEQAHATLQGQGLLLIDSGAQYQCGTTDITRVVAIGQPTQAQKLDFTYVLQSHIAMSQCVFPEGIASPLLDAIARAPLWAKQLDYGHGTGHGVGNFLNVHEEPQSLSFNAPVLPRTAMRAGMVTSIEPGLYRPQQWGIRIENLVANVPVAASPDSEFGPFLQFEPLTLCPIDTRLVAVEVLSLSERAWLNQYHQMVLERLQPHVQGAALTWLQQRTEAI